MGDLEGKISNIDIHALDTAVLIIFKHSLHELKIAAY